MNKKTYRILALVLALAMGLGVAGIALADATFRPSSGTAYATDAVNVRSGPGTSYTVLGYLSRGEKVTITGTVSNGWTQIQLPGNRLGYVSSAYLSASYPSGGCVIVTPSGDRYKVNTGALNVRSGPSTSYSVLGTVGQGQPLSCVGTSGNWTKIIWGSGYAYVYTSYLTSSYYGSVCPPNWNWGSNDVIFGSNQVYMQIDAPLYSTNNTSWSYHVRTLSAGTRATLLSMSNGWAKIYWNGGVYYTLGSNLAYAK